MLKPKIWLVGVLPLVLSAACAGPNPIAQRTISVEEVDLKHSRTDSSDLRQVSVNPSSLSPQETKQIGTPMRTPATKEPIKKSKGQSFDEQAKMLRPYCEEYIRTEWETYVLYEQGRYTWKITNIRKKGNDYSVDLAIRFTNHVGTAEKYTGKLVVEEMNGSSQIVKKGPWCDSSNGFCGKAQ